MYYLMSNIAWGTVFSSRSGFPNIQLPTRQVLVPLLGVSELASIFGRVAQVFASALADAFQRLQPQARRLFVLSNVHLHLCNSIVPHNAAVLV